VNSPYMDALEALTRERGVHGGLVVSERDGIVVEANVHTGVKSNIVAALAASIYRKTRLAAAAAGLGGVNYLELVAGEGRLCMAGHEDLVVVAITDATATVGAMRAATIRAAGRIG